MQRGPLSCKTLASVTVKALSIHGKGLSMLRTHRDVGLAASEEVENVVLGSMWAMLQL